MGKKKKKFLQRALQTKEHITNYNSGDAFSTNAVYQIQYIKYNLLYNIVTIHSDC